MSRFTITIEMMEVAEGDATDLAQRIWDENANDFDADKGEFDITINKDGFHIDWNPREPA